MKLECYMVSGIQGAIIKADGRKNIGRKNIGRIEAQFRDTPQSGPYVWGLYLEGLEPEKFDGGRTVKDTVDALVSNLRGKGVDMQRAHWSQKD